LSSDIFTVPVPVIRFRENAPEYAALAIVTDWQAVPLLPDAATHDAELATPSSPVIVLSAVAFARIQAALLNVRE
jgi:hypothetical protein